MQDIFILSEFWIIRFQLKFKSSNDIKVIIWEVINQTKHKHFDSNTRLYIFSGNFEYKRYF